MQYSTSYGSGDRNRPLNPLSRVFSTTDGNTADIVLVGPALPLPATMVSGLAVTSSLVLFQVYPGVLYALRTVDGSVAWSQGGPSGSFWSPCQQAADRVAFSGYGQLSTPTVTTNGEVYVGLCRSLVSVHASSGAVRWNVTAPNSAHVVSSPVLIDAYIGWGASNGFVARSQRSDGSFVRFTNGTAGPWAKVVEPGATLASAIIVAANGTGVCMGTSSNSEFCRYSVDGADWFVRQTVSDQGAPLQYPAGAPGSLAYADANGWKLLSAACYDLDLNNPSFHVGCGLFTMDIQLSGTDVWYNGPELSDTIPGYYAESTFDPAAHSFAVTKAGTVVTSAASGASYVVFTRFQDASAPSSRVQVLVAFNTSTGANLWSRAFPLASTWAASDGSSLPYTEATVALSDDGTLVFASLDGRVYGLRDCGAGSPASWSCVNSAVPVSSSPAAGPSVSGQSVASLPVGGKGVDARHSGLSKYVGPIQRGPFMTPESFSWVFAATVSSPSLEIGYSSVPCVSPADGTVFVSGGLRDRVGDRASRGLLIAVRSDGTEKWRLDVPWGSLSSPALYSDIVLVQSYPGVAMGVNATTGAVAWNISATLACCYVSATSQVSSYYRQSHLASPNATPDGVAVFAMCTEVSAFVAVTGQRLWSVTSASYIASTPALVDNRVIWCTVTGTVTAVERGSGATVWSTQPGPAGVGMQSSPTVSADGMVVYVVSDAGVVYQLWAETGALASSMATAPGGRVPISAPVGFPASVALDTAGNALIGGCYDLPVSGQAAGYRTECAYQSPGRWIVASDTIPGYDVETGFSPSVHAGSITKAGSIVSSAASGASYIVFTRFQGVVRPSARMQVVVGFNTSTGVPLWSVAFPLAPTWGDGSGDQVPFADTGVALGPDGTLYFASLDGKVYALQDCAPGSGDIPYDAGTTVGPFRCASCTTQLYNDGKFRRCQLCVAGKVACSTVSCWLYDVTAFARHDSDLPSQVRTLGS